MANLATCLNDQRKYTDSAAVLAMSDSAKRQLKDLAAGNETFFGCDLQKSELFRAQGMLAESEEILRTMLKHAPDHPDIDMRNGMQQLADLLIEMNRRTEAVTWMEKMLLMDRKMYLDVYREYLWTAWELGDCYAELGRFEDTIALHKQIERQVALSQWGDPNSRSKDIERVRGWIDRVEMMRREAEMQGPETSTISQGEGDDGMFALL
jgi:tetratricopeptide (TPR) repeat protein